MATHDFVVRNHGTVWVFTPITDEALEWLQENTNSEYWQWLGSTLVVDHRPARALLQGILEEGWEVTTHG